MKKIIILMLMLLVLPMVMASGNEVIITPADPVYVNQNLSFYCNVSDVNSSAVTSITLKKNDEKTRMTRIFELFGFVLFAGIFENIGVIANTYNYSLDRIVMVGVVPLSLLLIEAVTFYAALQFAESKNYPKWTIPIVVGFLGVLQDLTIDPAAVFDLHLIDGVMQGRWNWTVNYENTFFGIPFFNYSGWFLLMFYYTALILIGRKRYEKSGYNAKMGMFYTIIAPFIGVLLIISPITTFILFLYPIFPKYLNRTAEIVMLSSIAILCLSVLIKYRKRSVPIDFKDKKLIWVIPLILHTFDIILAFALGITIAYIPVLLFAAIHMIYLTYYLSNKSMVKSDFEKFAKISLFLNKSKNLKSVD